jgi:hypothetical protein
MTGATNDESQQAAQETSAIPVWVMILIVLSLVTVVGVLTFLYWRRRERVLREECADMLAEYMPMDNSGQVCALKANPPHNTAFTYVCFLFRSLSRSTDRPLQWLN